MEEENQMGEAAALGRLRQEGEMRASSDGSDDESVGGASERQRA